MGDQIELHRDQSELACGQIDLHCGQIERPSDQIEHLAGELHGRPTARLLHHVPASVDYFAPHRGRRNGRSSRGLPLSQRDFCARSTAAGLLPPKCADAAPGHMFRVLFVQVLGAGSDLFGSGDYCWFVLVGNPS